MMDKIKPPQKLMFEAKLKYNIAYQYLENNAMLVWNKVDGSILGTFMGFGEFPVNQRNDACLLFYNNNEIGVSHIIHFLDIL